MLKKSKCKYHNRMKTKSMLKMNLPECGDLIHASILVREQQIAIWDMRKILDRSVLRRLGIKDYFAYCLI